MTFCVRDFCRTCILCGGQLRASAAIHLLAGRMSARRTANIGVPLAL
jgi:hypothetical protein